MTCLLGFGTEGKDDHAISVGLANWLVGPAAAPVELRRQGQYATDIVRLLWRDVVIVADALCVFGELSGDDLRALLAWK
jgi:hypothetical protein